MARQSVLTAADVGSASRNSTVASGRAAISAANRAS
jgi:hypothetical protein